MGTNYYIVKNGPSCVKPVHIGKSSIGWLFLFQAQKDFCNEPPVKWNTWPQVKSELKKYTVDSTDYVIIDEYDKVISYDDFADLVETKQRDPQNLSNPDNFSHCRNIDGYRFSDEVFW